MKLISYTVKHQLRCGFVRNGQVYRLGAALPNHGAMNRLLARDTARLLAMAKKAERETGDIQLVCPVPEPGVMLDGYAFRQHVESARRNRGLDMISAYDEFPVVYYTNARNLQGPGYVQVMPDHLQLLDFELEVAAVIGRPGKNIRAEAADSHIAGLMILNDFSARRLQMEEMQLSLGPAKGKDFATAAGPWLVTLDELEEYEVPCKSGHAGKSWKLEMTSHVNGKQVSTGSLADMDWTFAELIERASYGCQLLPGDIIGSGTVGTGCFLELQTGQWLQSGDLIVLEVTGLGKLENTIITSDMDWSILDRKKQLTT